MDHWEASSDESFEDSLIEEGSVHRRAEERREVVSEGSEEEEMGGSSRVVARLR